MRQHRGDAAGTMAGLALTFAATVIVAGCTGVSHRVIRTDHQTFTIPTDAHTDLVVNTFNGNVDVTAIGPGSADVSVTPHGSGFSDSDAQAALDTVNVADDLSGTTLTVTATATGDGPAGSSRGADVDIQVPPDTSVTINTSNGHVAVINVQGTSTIHSSNGSIETRAGAGVTIETSNGPVSVTSPTGTVNVTTTNGGVDVLDARAATATVNSSNGPISFSGALVAGAHSFTTSNGSLTLRLPSDQGFTLDASTNNATTSSDFPGISAGDGTLQGSVGNGSAQISARTSNGAIQVLQLKP